MKNFNSQEDELIRSLLTEAGSESPSVDFHRKILLQIETRNVVIYQPLIPPIGIKFIIAGIIFLGMITLFFNPSGETSLSYWDKIPELTPSILDFNFPKIKIPRINLGPIFNTSLLAFSLLIFSWFLYNSKKLNIE